MASLFTALGTASDSLDVLQQAIGVVQNNVTNATTPGYVTQTLQLASRSFDPSSNLWGGVESTGTQSARDVYAEQSVWSANQQSGYSSQQSASLNELQQIFDVTGQSGIPSALSTLYSAFSAWSTSPSNATAQQGVITAAQGLSTAFSQTASQAQQIESDTDGQLTSSVTQLNQDTAQVATINGEIRNGDGDDAGLQAQLYNTLQDISGLANVTVNFESDGTATVLLADNRRWYKELLKTPSASTTPSPRIPSMPAPRPARNCSIPTVRILLRSSPRVPLALRSISATPLCPPFLETASSKAV